MAVYSDVGVRGPLAKLLEVDRRCVHLRPVFGDALEAIEVCGEQSLVGRSSPPRYPLKLAGLERRDLEEDVEPTGLVRPGEAEPHQTIHRRRQPAVRAGAGTEAERLAELASRQLGGDLMSPQLGVPAQKQRGAGPDDGRPALLDIGVGQVEPDLTDPRVRMVDRGEDKITITFHAL